MTREDAVAHTRNSALAVLVDRAMLASGTDKITIEYAEYRALVKRREHTVVNFHIIDSEPDNMAHQPEAMEISFRPETMRDTLVRYADDDTPLGVICGMLMVTLPTPFLNLPRTEVENTPPGELVRRLREQGGDDSDLELLTAILTPPKRRAGARTDA